MHPTLTEPDLADDVSTVVQAERHGWRGEVRIRRNRQPPKAAVWLADVGIPFPGDADHPDDLSSLVNVNRRTPIRRSEWGSARQRRQQSDSALGCPKERAVRIFGCPADPHRHAIVIDGVGSGSYAEVDETGPAAPNITVVRPLRLVHGTQPGDLPKVIDSTGGKCIEFAERLFT